MTSSEADVLALLRAAVARRLGLDVSAISADEPLAGLGIDSAAALAVAEELQSQLGFPVDPTTFFASMTVAEAATRLCSPEVRSPARPVATEAGPAIAIVGMACRAPGAGDLAGLWSLLQSGGAADRRADPTGAGTPPVGELADRLRFDEAFFGLRADEARSMDVQQRWLLEVVWEALEDAGLTADELRGRAVGVFVGISSAHLMAQVRAARAPTASDVLGNSLSVAANRISYHFDWRGPSMAIDTACSSSLTALHLAVRALRAGECETAFVCGVNAADAQDVTAALDAAGMLAPDGACKTFDAAADGYGRSEGCGVIVLRRHHARPPGWGRAYALVAGTAINQDGRSNGITAPNRDAQVAVIEAACADAAISAASVRYVEAHGTGTYLGDPIEIRALAQAYRPDRAKPLKVGSVKSNIGHLEAAAGILGVIKTALCLHHRLLAPSVNLTKPNPLIPFEDLGIEIQTTPTAWAESEFDRVAAVSSFGFGGANAHAILKAVPTEATTRVDDERPRLFSFSAHSQPALGAMAERWAQWLEARPAADLADVASVLAHHRSRLPVRTALVAGSTGELARQLRRPLVSTHDNGGRALFVFSGQGSQRPGMGRRWRDLPLAARSVLETCERVCRREADWSLLAELEAPVSASRLHLTELAQPVLFAWQAALGTLWRAWGVSPQAVIGHSVGEIAAAHAAGTLGLEDAMRMAIWRGQAMRDLRGKGAMLAVELPRDRVQSLCDQRAGLSLAASNGPNRNVVSGPLVLLEALKEELEDQDLFARFVSTDYPFHSMACEAAGRDFVTRLGAIEFRRPTTPWFSTVLGRRVEAEPLDPDYWRENVVREVRFAQALGAAHEIEMTHVVEIGGQPALASALKDNFASATRSPILIAADGAAETASMGALAAWHNTGGRLNLAAMSERRPFSDAGPCYPWAGERHGPPLPRKSSRARADKILGDAALAPDWLGARVFRGTLDPSIHTWLADHVISGSPIVPAAAYVGFLLECAREVAGDPPWSLEHVAFLRPLAVGEEPIELTATLERDPSEGRWKIRVGVRLEDGEWSLVARAEVTAAVDYDLPEARGTERREVTPFYTELAKAGYGYGPSFQRLKDIRAGVGRAVGVMEQKRSSWLIEPPLLDGLFQLAAAAHGGAGENMIVPARIRRLTARNVSEGRVEAIAALADSRRGAAVIAALGLTDALGPALSADGVVFTKLTPAVVARPLPAHRYLDRWRPRIASTAASSARVFILGATAQTQLLADALSETTILADEVELGRALARGVGRDDRVVVVDLRWGALSARGASADEIAASYARVRDTIAILSDAPLEQSVTYLLASDTSIERGGSPFMGLFRTAHLEYPTVVSKVVMLGGLASAQARAAHLARETEIDDGETEIVATTGQSLVRRLATASEPPTDELAELAADGWYLVTGGTGGIGASLLPWMAMCGARRILVASRNARGGLSAPLAGLDGVDIRTVDLDIAAEDASEQIARAVADWPPLRGIFHLAGALRDRAMADLGVADFQTVLAPKLAVASLVERLGKREHLRFVVGFGSAAASLGSPGQANYAAANSAMEALLHDLAADGWPTLCVHWGPWARAGMAARLEESGSASASMGLNFLEPAAGLETLGRLMAGPGSSSTVTPFDLANLLQFYPDAPGLSAFAEILVDEAAHLRSNGGSARVAERPNLVTPFVAPEGEIEVIVTAMWRRALVIDRVGVNDSFFELGGDSVFANQILSDINRRFGIKLKGDEAFDSFTPRALGKLVQAQLEGARTDHAEFA
jgi:acyl transferase domain-containing protein/acyl carrier protein